MRFKQSFKMRQKLFYFAIFLILFGVVFRSLLLNLSAALIDWRDYALMVWIMFQNMSKIMTFNFHNYFDTNAFYPHHYSLLFSDLLLPQSVLSLPFYLLTNNLVLSFNLVFIITFILNYISTFLFWKQIFKKDSLAFLGSLLIIFSPFFHLENSHFQMMSYWPFFFSLYFLVRANTGNRNLFFFLSGLFVAIQFIASVYLSVYLIFTIALYSFFNFWNLKDLKKNFTGGFILCVTFLTLSGFFIKGYLDMKYEYNFKRDLGEYITYSASLSDYIFTSSVNSIVHRSFLMKKWNGFDKNGWGGHASFPGFLILITALTGIFSIIKDKKELLLKLKIDKQKGFFITIMLLGFIFSLGPRLNFNGQYAYIPLPYTLVLKFVPLSEATRVPSRWSFLFFFGIIFFAVLGLNKISGSKYRNYILTGFFLIFLLEYLPLNMPSSIESYTDNRDEILKQLCLSGKEVVLELPVTHLSADSNIADGLSYITKRQLASTFNNCRIVNGYSGYDIPDNFELSDKLEAAIELNDVDKFVYELKHQNITIVKFNPDHFNPPKQAKLYTFLKLLDSSKQLRKIDPTIFSVNK